ncbi:YIP1 family protein [Desulfobacula sp.]|uniref:YIP1 family protein n=1 Tax=Desulfobacula sp. TaxID=2593537 RepID=UPI002621B03A|nr:YIP1 family protein [Desulfobacula sp.]
MLESNLKIWQFYSYSLIQLLIEPGQFFKELPEKTTVRKTVGFMMICCVFFTIASLLTGAYAKSGWVMAIIFFANAAGMIVISSGLGYIVMVIILGKRTSFFVIFSLYVFSSGVTLFLSWLPFLLWVTEPWKWWLIYTGFKTACQFTGKQALLILLVSMTIQFFLLYSAAIAFVN